MDNKKNRHVWIITWTKCMDNKINKTSRNKGSEKKYGNKMVGITNKIKLYGWLRTL